MRAVKPQLENRMKGLDIKHFAMQSLLMHTDWALENLKTIRTLMERTAVYRRAMGPVMVVVGVTGLAAGALGAFLNLTPALPNVGYWIGVAVVCLLEACWMIRRQALKDAESFWSPPMRRVMQAVAPAFFAGAVAGLPFVFLRWETVNAVLLLMPAWMVFYGFAMHSAGFFMPRGFKLFGWGFVLGGVGVFAAIILGAKNGFWLSNQAVNWLMGGIFGGAHLAYGLYLLFTENGGNAS